jgi:hypothetical protein
VNLCIARLFYYFQEFSTLLSIIDDFYFLLLAVGCDWKFCGDSQCIFQSLRIIWIKPTNNKKNFAFEIEKITNNWPVVHFPLWSNKKKSLCSTRSNFLFQLTLNLCLIYSLM